MNRLRRDLQWIKSTGNKIFLTMGLYIGLGALLGFKALGWGNIDLFIILGLPIYAGLYLFEVWLYRDEPPALQKKEEKDQPPPQRGSISSGKDLAN